MCKLRKMNKFLILATTLDINLSVFEKQGTSRWEKEINTIVDTKPHSYKLNDGKWCRYYQLQLVKDAEEIKKVGRPTKHTLQTLRKINTVKRRLKHEDVSLKHIVNTTRTRQKTDKFSY